MSATREGFAGSIAGFVLRTPEGVRNNAKTIYKLPMPARGFGGRVH